jgi:hypothetical protein
MAQQPKMPDISPDEMLDTEEPNVTPEEQKQYDAMVLLSMELLYKEDRLPVLVERLKAGADNISNAIGHVSAMTMLTVFRSAEQSGQTIADEILMNAAGEIVSQVTDIAEAAGIIKPEHAQAIAEAALYEHMREWGETWNREGRFTDEKKLEAQDELKAAGITYARPAEQEAELQQKAAPEQPAPEQAPPAGGIVNQIANQG